MAKRKFLGEFEHLVLLAVARLGDDGYGASILDEIHTRTDRDVSVGALYATLDRLADKGYVSSRKGACASDRGGRPKRFYTLTASGEDALLATRQLLESMWKGVRLGGASG